MTDEDKTPEELKQELAELRRQLADQARLHRADKVAALERLAGGAAHDINNALTGILGYVSVLLRGREPDDPEYEDLDAIRRAAGRIKGLTRQMLAFSRRLPVQRVETNLNELIGGVRTQLQELVGQDVGLEFDLAFDLGPTSVDAEQIGAALMALVQNAREATPAGGRITVETANVELLDECACRCGQMFCGSHVMLAVRDTGAGMDEDTLAHAFEPFFTTKGKRPGMGLPVVAGLVALNGGHITAESTPGHGTTVRIYLPRAERAMAEAAAAPQVAAEEPGSRLSVLVVEDEADIRYLTERYLTMAGYHVLVAGDGESALEIVHQRPVHLLATDIGLPGALDGRELAERAKAHQPGLKVLLMTGSIARDLLDLPQNYVVLEKPFTSEVLLAAVRRALEG